MALMWRAMRRRVPGLLCRGGAFVVLALVFINLTFPNHPIAAPVSPDYRHNAGFQPNNLEDAKEDDVAAKLHPAPRQGVAKPDRSNEFYKNILIHFDLKGAPPKTEYFLELLRFIAKNGATGILLEWEDTFPFTGVLEKAKNTDAYSLDDVKRILSEAKSLGLDVVPLVQTFGHLEWILKYDEFVKYRENEAYPQVRRD